MSSTAHFHQNFLEDSLDASEHGWTFSSAVFETQEEAEAFVARFPKYAKVKVVFLSSYSGSLDEGNSQRHVHYTGRAQGTLKADGVNKGRNETGIKRLRAIQKVMGTDLVYRMPYGNSYTPEQLEAELVA